MKSRHVVEEESPLKKLFIVDGLSGVGKSDLLRYIARSHRESATVLTKFTTRAKRRVEEARTTDLAFVSESEFARLVDEHPDFYKYTYGGAQYGVARSAIIEALNAYEYVFTIVRNRRLISRIAADLSTEALVVPIFVYTDRDLVKKRLAQRGFGAADIQFRLERSREAWRDYLEYPDGSTRVIINNSRSADFHRKINALIDEYATERVEDPSRLYINPSLSYELLKALVGSKHDIVKHLETSVFEKNIFLMMKFRPENRKFYEFIKRRIEDAGFNCVRADDPLWNITGDVYNPLAVLYCCKYGIALFDEPEEHQAYNPNVAYELGVMQHQNKKCLFLRHTSLPDVPFDLIKDLRKDYTNEIEFEELFTRWLVEIADR